jgi:hypothetical protein
MVCYFSVKDGLYSHESMNPRISCAKFPDLKNVSSESVANQMTKLICKHSDPQLKEPARVQTLLWPQIQM